MSEFFNNPEFFTDVNLGLSKKLAMEIESKENMCHFNTWKANLCHPELKYYRGFVVNDGYVAVHSWLVDQDKMVVEPTLILHGPLGEEYIGIEIEK